MRILFLFGLETRDAFQGKMFAATQMNSPVGVTESGRPVGIALLRHIASGSDPPHRGLILTNTKVITLVALGQQHYQRPDHLADHMAVLCLHSTNEIHE